MDVDFYVASPAGTPRHTLRWGKTYDYLPINGFSEHQDLLHLQMPADGAYYVVAYPRKRDESVPQFQTSGGGHIVKIGGDHGTDYAFLASPETAAEDDQVMFRGTAASVQDRADGLVLSLGAAGEVSLRGGYGIASRSAVSLRVSPQTLVVHVGNVADPTEIVLTTAGVWAVEDADEVVLRRDGETRYVIGVPAGVEEIRLSRR